MHHRAEQRDAQRATGVDGRELASIQHTVWMILAQSPSLAMTRRGLAAIHPAIPGALAAVSVSRPVKRRTSPVTPSSAQSCW